jgi:hypothetical protein
MGIRKGECQVWVSEYVILEKIGTLRSVGCAEGKRAV